MTSSLPSAILLAILQAEYMAKKSEERSSQATRNEEWCRIQPPPSMIHWSSFPVSPLKTVVVKQNLCSWPQNMSPPSLPRFLAFLKKATTFLPTLALDHWLLSSKQLNLSSVTTHPGLFTVYDTEIILYNLQQKETLCLIFPFVISLEFYENFFLFSKFKDSFCFIILIIIYYPLSGMQIVKVNSLSIFLILL